MWLILLLVVIFLLLFFSSVEIVRENTVYVVEFLGKFSRVMTAGLNYKVPLFEQVAEKITLKQQNFTVNGRFHAKDKMVIDIAANIVFSVAPTAEAVCRYTYSLVERDKTIAATIENSLRTTIARETYMEVLEKKEVLTQDVKRDLEVQFKEWGISIFSFQIISVHPVSTY